MNTQVRSNLLKNSWLPKSYSVSELSDLLSITQDLAEVIIQNVNAGPDGIPIIPWITHHDLVIYLQDDLSISSVPDSIDEFSAHGKWLIENEWSIDITKKVYRWIDPYFTNRRVNLRSALMIQLSRIRPDNIVFDIFNSSEVVDVDFELLETPKGKQPGQVYIEIQSNV